MTNKVLKYTIALGFAGLLLACVITFLIVRMHHTQSATELPFLEHRNETEPSERHLVLEILDRCSMRDTMPAAREITWEEYCKLKAEYVRRHEQWKPGYALTYRRKEGDSWRSYRLELESFNDDTVWVAELTQYKSMGWDWVARYQIQRSPQVNEEFRIVQILEHRSRVIGGIKYGMTVREVIAKKGKHYKIHHHAEFGSADLVYDDVKVSIRGWAGDREGRVVGVEPTKKETLEFLKDQPYEDEK